jgi:quinoprotein glucose dehydrogenase
LFLMIHSGGPIVTAGGLIFAAGTEDANLHVLDVHTGNLIRDIPLPRKSLGTPVTYKINGTSGR